MLIIFQLNTIKMQLFQFSMLNYALGNYQLLVIVDTKPLIKVKYILIIGG